MTSLLSLSDLINVQLKGIMLFLYGGSSNSDVNSVLNSRASTVKLPTAVSSQSEERNMSTLQDIEQHADLLVVEYLKSWQCSQTLEMFSNKIGSRPAPSTELQEAYHAHTIRRDKAEDRCASLLEFMVRGAKQRMAQEQVQTASTLDGADGSTRRRRTSSESDGAGIGEWSKQDVSALKKAIKQTATIEDKNLRWKQIASLVGNDKSKKQCYLKYKQLKEEQKSASESDKTGSNSRRRTSKDPGARRNSAEISTNDVDIDPAAPTSKRAPTDTTKSSFMLKKDFSDTPEMTLDAKLKLVDANISTFVPVATSLSRASSVASDTLEMEDCESFDAPIVAMKPARSSTKPLTIGASGAPRTNAQKGVAPTAEQITSVRQLLFGKQDDSKTFNSHWDEQGFCFNNTTKLQYGLVQHEGGPCGVLAVVQAYVLRFLLLQPPRDWRNPDVDSQQRALVSALTHILWQASRSSQQSQQCTLVLLQEVRQNGDKRRRFMSNMALHPTSSESETRELIRSNLDQFTSPRGSGLVQFVLSVVLTRGVTIISSEMDSISGAETSGQLVGGHDYCTQELVNLLLCGRASSNVFDGERKLDDSSDAVTLHGIPSQCTVGFLSLFEAYEYLVVGSHLKRPAFNIWVVCSESHYSVLFADPSMLQESPTKLEAHETVDLYYYDELANQDEEIRLTVRTKAKPEGSRVSARHDDLVPPLNLVVQTKWPRAEVDWNGVEPLL